MNSIEITNLGKKYNLGSIHTGTLTEDLKSFFHRLRDKNEEAGEKEFWALRDFNLSVKEGEALGIIGENGAGKSTLLKILSRITSPTTGEAVLNGVVSSMLEVGTGFHRELTGRENIYLNGTILGMSKKEIDKKLDEIVDFSECEKFIDTPVKRYSSGMYVKLAFAVSAHLNSNILIMDEVLAVGDMKFQEKCLGKMGSAAQNEGKTVLYVSHNMNTIRKLCNRCIVLSHGKKIFDGDVDGAIALYSDSASVIRQHNELETFDTEGIHRMEFLTLDFLREDNASYKRSDSLAFLLRFKSLIDASSLHIRFIIRWEDDITLGMYISNQFDLKKGEIKNFSVSLPLDKFPNGKYHLRLVVSSTNSFGTHSDLGRCTKAAHFEVRDDENAYHNMPWNGWYWGAFLGKVKVE
ncbi:MAG: ABC transporter ATP-binding protein [Treponema sp.]|uniref:ABC transporter ATP-binding protein n=1 Tax=Treponema sp. TaxID=166 RepID=UPI0025EF9715|nr:ABC transporter ATP-binding protein [Treponema sp.]MBQ8678847.1 ABC transporter ATP-binding protein [Treponema sp.]